MNFKLKKRLKSSHKGNNGRVLVIGGSDDYHGAPVLAAMSCLAVLRSGSDLVTLAAPYKVGWAASSISPDIIVKKLKGKYIKESHLKQLLNLAEKSDVVLLGNGIGLRNDTERLINKFVEIRNHDVVLDADAIKVVNKIDKMENCIITPHKRELQIFLENNYNSSDITKVKLLAKSFLKNNVILLKGKKDMILGEKTAYNTTGNEGMTKGGTGDVLAGLTAGFLAQGNSPFDSALAAAYVNGKAGDNLKEKMGYSFLASDLVNEIPHVMRKLNG